MNTPIGIFDSGLGGLTVVKEVLKHLPAEPVVYFGDTARVPYGTKSKETITRFSTENIRFLKTHDVKMIVVACHTASSLALESLQGEFALPILGVVQPGARKAAAVTKNGRIGVIGTKSTISSGAYEAAIKALDPSIEVFSAACPLFVALIEEGWTDGEVVRNIVSHYLDPLKAQNIDTLVLGCTHYPILTDRIREASLKQVQLVNPAEETALAAKSLLEQSGIQTRVTSEINQIQYFVSDEPQQFRKLGERFLGQKIHSVERVSDHYFQTIP